MVWRKKILAEMLGNKLYLYDDKMTVLCNTQDGHFDVDLKDVSSLKGQLVEAGGVELWTRSFFCCLLGAIPLDLPSFSYNISRSFLVFSPLFSRNPPLVLPSFYHSKPPGLHPSLKKESPSSKELSPSCWGAAAPVP